MADRHGERGRNRPHRELDRGERRAPDHVDDRECAPDPHTTTNVAVALVLPTPRRYAWCLCSHSSTPGAARSRASASRSRTSATSAARYCMPAEGLEWLRRDELLSFEELAAARADPRVHGRGRGPADRRRAARAPRPAGPRRAARGDCRECDDLSLTTNGVLLDRYAGPLVEAGLRRVNVSLDSLSHVRFAEITRRDALDARADGARDGRGVSRSSARSRSTASRSAASRRRRCPRFAELARRKPYVVRFIEFMPLDADRPGAATTCSPARRSGRSSRRAGRSTRSRRRRRRRRAASVLRTAAGEIGFVNPVSEPFCSTCDRIRLTADGQLRTCLFSRRDWDLKTPLRDGATDAELEAVLRNAVAPQGAEAPHQRARLRSRDPLDVSPSPCGKSTARSPPGSTTIMTIRFVTAPAQMTTATHS